MTDEQASVGCADAGGRYAEPVLASDAMREPFWSLGMCLAWIAWRDRYRLVRAYGPWRKEHGLPPVASLSDLCDQCIEGLFNLSQEPKPLPEAEVMAQDIMRAAKGILSALGGDVIAAIDTRSKAGGGRIDRFRWVKDDFGQILGSEVFGVKELIAREDYIYLADDFKSIVIPSSDLLRIWPANKLDRSSLEADCGSGRSDYASPANKEPAKEKPTSLRAVIAAAKAKLPSNQQHQRVILRAIEELGWENWPNMQKAELRRSILGKIQGTPPSDSTIDRVLKNLQMDFPLGG